MIKPFEHSGWRLLDKTDFDKVRHLMRADFNVLFARQVVEKGVSGLVYVDELARPECCLVHHPYGMLLLAGRPNEDFNNALKDFMLNNGSERTLWLQAFPDIWHDIIDSILGYDLKFFDGCQKQDYQLRSGVVRFMRLNFRFDRERYLAHSAPEVPEGLKLRHIDETIFNNFEGTVVAKHFWDSADDFETGGKGFALLEGEKIASASFSAFMVDDFLELGIETAMAYREKGCGEIVCRALIDHALANGLEPVWSCRKDNIGSKKLAEKLGFEVCLELPYYGLRKI